jgi:multimeric flavodoxin WrbA
MKTIVILGTAREESNTLSAIKEICPFDDYELIDLRTLQIDSYSYTGPTGTDDFLMVAEKMKIAENIIFATPVYWYAMSFTLKNFFDRLTDLLSTYKSIGKALKGKRTYLISTGSDTELPDGFEVPFRLTSNYFEMIYVRAFYRVTKQQ